MKIKFSDKKTKSKIIIDAYLRDGTFYARTLQGNIYLNGERIYRPTTQQIGEIDPRVANLLSFDCTHKDGAVNIFENIRYFCELARKNIKETYTQEDSSEDAIQLWRDVNKKYHLAYKVADRDLGHMYAAHLGDYMNKQHDLYKFAGIYKTREYWESVVYKYAPRIRNSGRILNLIKDYLSAIDTYKQHIDRYRWASLPRRWDLWTYDRLAAYLNVNKSDLSGVAMAAPDEFINEVRAVFELSKQNSRQKLDQLLIDLDIKLD